MSAKANLKRIAKIDDNDLDAAIKIAQKIFGFDNRSTKFALNSENAEDKTNYLNVIADDPEENLIEDFFNTLEETMGNANTAPARKAAPTPARKVAAKASARKVVAKAPARNGNGAAAAPAGGTKKELALKMLSRLNGVSIDQLSEKLNITPKAAHGILYFLRRDNHNIETLGGGNFQLVQKQARRAARA